MGEIATEEVLTFVSYWQKRQFCAHLAFRLSLICLLIFTLLAISTVFLMRSTMMYTYMALFVVAVIANLALMIQSIRIARRALGEIVRYGKAAG